MHSWLVKHFLFPLHEAAKGHPTLRILAEMEQADRLSATELEELRRQRLQHLIADSYQNVPYVRNLMNRHGLTPESIGGPEDLPKLPIMTKSEMRKQREQLRSTAAGKLTWLATGGSTGDPLIFDIGKVRIGSRVACRQRVARWWGVSIGDAEIALWGSPVELTRQDRLRRMRDVLMCQRLWSAFEMNEATMTAYLDALANRPARYIFAYPSAIYQLCQHAQRLGRNLRNLGTRVVFVTSEVLYPYQRELIAETLNCPVADGYGGRDSGFIAHECPQGGMHILSDTVVVEMVDAEGNPVQAGEPGEIVVTDLYSQEFPFIRYATGDVAVLSSKRCPCGRPHPMLERIQGRSNDTIIAANGRVINDQALVYQLRNVAGIERFRIIQKRIDHLHVQLVCTSDYHRDGEEQLRRGWEQLLRTNLTVTFEYLPEMPPEANRKFRHIVSELARETVGAQDPMRSSAAR